MNILKKTINSLLYRIGLIKRKLKRVFKTIFQLNALHLNNIPVIINNRNRYRYMLMLIEWLEQNGMNNIYILDNNSTYLPLLNYYKNTNHKVIYLNKNVGHKALWETNILSPLTNNYYIYTDADVVPTNNCPGDLIQVMYKLLKNNYAIDKVGIGLQIDNLPAHYSLKDEVIKWETKFWKHPVNSIAFKAPVDTTFALYAPYAKGGGECKAYRTNSPYLAMHLPWYENTNNPNQEDEFYKLNVAPLTTHWSLK